LIPVIAAAEPQSFDATVRQRGTRFLNSLPSLVKVDFRGREYWRYCLEDLAAAYGNICAYTCHFVAVDVGGNSVEHFVPKAVDPLQAYEWTNFRFVASRLNSRRGQKTIIDPFLVQQDMFQLDFPSLLIDVGVAHTQNALLHDTIKALKLNDGKVRKSRERYVKYYANKQISIKFLRENAPFIHYEIKRQKILTSHLRAIGF
jgi:hypothetical protein